MKSTAIAIGTALAVWQSSAPFARAWQDGAVAVAACADKDYVQQKFGERGSKARAESFVFAQGKFFGGYLRDASLDKTQFRDIARNLAPALAKQSYYPAADAKSADLLIVVHWGITSVEENPDHGQTEMDQLQKDGNAYNAKFSSGDGGRSSGGIADPGNVASDLAIARGQSAASGSAPGDNAQLLGYASELRAEEYRSLGVGSGMTETDRRLREELEDQRYFVILMAYDCGSLKSGRTGTKPKLLWSTHFSMRAIGFNFTSALPAMSRVASNFFGHQVPGLLLDANRVPEGRVDLGELKTVEEKRTN
jgi:hypothetical protein